MRRPSKRGLRQVDFVFEGQEIRGLEQNPLTKSQWALMARSGKKVMQFLQSGKYVANIVDGKVRIYGAPDKAVCGPVSTNLRDSPARDFGQV